MQLVKPSLLQPGLFRPLRPPDSHSAGEGPSTRQLVSTSSSCLPTLQHTTGFRSSTICAAAGGERGQRYQHQHRPRRFGNEGSKHLGTGSYTAAGSPGSQGQAGNVHTAEFYRKFSRMCTWADLTPLQQLDFLDAAYQALEGATDVQASHIIAALLGNDDTSEPKKLGHVNLLAVLRAPLSGSVSHAGCCKCTVHSLHRRLQTEASMCLARVDMSM